MVVVVVPVTISIVSPITRGGEGGEEPLLQPFNDRLLLLRSTLLSISSPGVSQCNYGEPRPGQLISNHLDESKTLAALLTI